MGETAAFLQRLIKDGLKLSPERAQIGTKQVTSLGNLVYFEGVKPDPAEVKALTNMPVPTDVGQARFAPGANVRARQLIIPILFFFMISEKKKS